MTMGNTVEHFNACDSTWEDEYNHEDSTEWQRSEHSNIHAARDMQNYRRRWRTIQHDDMKNHDVVSLQEEDSLNLLFYQNKIPFSSDGIYIDELHTNWFGNHERLEHVHSYIQWLFPTQDPGINTSNTLSPKAIMLFRRDEKLKERLLMSYKLMLDFYGIDLISEETGEVRRAVNWTERFANLNRNLHNNLRITRILKSLGLLGFPHYQAPLVHFFLVETLVNGTLPRVKQSVLDYFMFAVVDKSKRKELIKFALCYYEPKDRFVWCPRRIQTEFLKEVKRAERETDRYQK